LWLSTEKSFHEEPETIRSWFIYVPATVVKTARKLILKLSERYVFKQQGEENRKTLIFPEFCLTRFGDDIFNINNISGWYAYFMVIYH